MKEIQPSPGFLLIEPIVHQENIRDSGVFVPQEYSETPNTANVWRTSEYKVFSTGERLPAWFNKGDEVLVKKGAGLDVKEKGRDLLFISFEDILGVLK